MTSRELVEALWRLFDERLWDQAAELLAADIVCEWPHTGERIAGAEAFIEVNARYPDWDRLDVERIVADGPEVVAEVAVSHPGGVARVASFATVVDGRIVRLREYWVEECAEDPPAWRAGRFRRGPVAPPSG